jgi:hypothetical protein
MTMEEELGVVLEPLHPGVDDDDMARFFMIQMPDSTMAERVIARLRLSDSIEAAYLKPTDEAPEEEIAET